MVALEGTAHVSLVVEPHDDTRGLYVDFLQHSGWETLEAEDGGTGLSTAISRHRQLLVTERRLPRIDGYHLTQILKRDSSTANIAVVVVTADARPESLDRARRVGADAVFAKPIALDDLFARIGEVVRRQAELRARSDALRFRANGLLASADHILRRAKTMSRAMGRYSTTTPPAAPPPLMCVNCDSPLQYHRSYIGGVNRNSPEQWDYYECPNGCGQFQYRQRTRKLRRVS
ncbi:MAG: hypothetical protein C5B57_02240 [Blastocatellia bacterium]|nr:MAG: hypothetical protein C5B57_02240 [Blastocatellia bacterium]